MTLPLHHSSLPSHLVPHAPHKDSLPLSDPAVATAAATPTRQGRLALLLRMGVIPLVVGLTPTLFVAPAEVGLPFLILLALLLPAAFLSQQGRPASAPAWVVIGLLLALAVPLLSGATGGGTPSVV